MQPYRLIYYCLFILELEEVQQRSKARQPLSLDHEVDMCQPLDAPIYPCPPELLARTDGTSWSDTVKYLKEISRLKLHEE
jgi:hypothetical protein